MGNKLQPKDIFQIVKNWVKHLQLPNDWKHYEPSSTNESLKKISAGKQVVEKMYYPKKLPCPPQAEQKEEVWNRKPRKMTRNLGAIRTNIDIVKEFWNLKALKVRK
jgi:hypothetical protein